MTMKVTLNLPDKLPRWATDPGRTLEPDETGTTLSNKDLGWLLGDEPPARWFNWLLNRSYQWVQRLGGVILGNWTPLTISNNEWRGIIYNPEIAQWLLVRLSSTQNAYAEDGYNWTAGTVFPGFVTPESVAIDSQYLIVAATSSDIYYGADASGSWSIDTGPTAMTTIEKIATQYPDSDFIAACDSLGAVMFASGGVGTSWASPSGTTPSYTGAASCVGFEYLGNSTWMILSQGAETKISVDNCDNWSNTASDPSSILTSAAKALAHNRTTGTILALGNNGTTAKIARSTDNGTGWTESTINLPDGATSLSFENGIYCCGGDMWLMISDSSIFISYDDGKTFNSVRYNQIPTTVNFYIGCDGSKVILAAGDVSTSDGSVYVSLSIPN